MPKSNATTTRFKLTGEAAWLRDIDLFLA